MATQHEEKYAKFLQWDRDANSRLYYAFWIVFLGGFVLSLQLRHTTGCLQSALLILFRFLAILGSAVNFFHQNLAIDELSKLRQSITKLDHANWLRESQAGDKISPADLLQASLFEEQSRSLRSDSERLSTRVRCLNLITIVCGVAYLALALALSCIYYY